MLKNVDHLFKSPAFTTAVAIDCCNPNAPGTPAGGLWVVEPSRAMGEQLWRMMTDGQPAYNPDTGNVIIKADGSGSERGAWIYGGE